MAGTVANELIQQLQSHEIEVSIVEDCDQVVRVLSENPTAGALLTQLSLPHGNWRDVIEQVRSVSASLPVFVMAPRVTPQLWWDTLDCCASDVVNEPMTAAEFAWLVDLIRRQH